MHIVLGTPMYGGLCHGTFTQSAMAFSRELYAQNIGFTSAFIFNESLIQRARNKIAAIFLSIPDATHLMFVDGDIDFDLNDVVRMINANKPVIVSPVPLKGIHWDRVRQAALDGEENLEAVSGYYAINPTVDGELQGGEEPFEISLGGTGFMLIQRHVFESLMPITKKYKNDQSGADTIPEIYDFFRVEIDEPTGSLLSEDYYFCKSYKMIGGSIWCAPWPKIGHSGNYMFTGRYCDAVKVDAIKK